MVGNHWCVGNSSAAGNPRVYEDGWLTTSLAKNVHDCPLNSNVVHQPKMFDVRNLFLYCNSSRLKETHSYRFSIMQTTFFNPRVVSCSVSHTDLHCRTNTCCMLDYICGKGGIMYALFLAQLFLSWPELVVYVLDQIQASFTPNGERQRSLLNTTEQGFRPEQRVYCIAV